MRKWISCFGVIFMVAGMICFADDIGDKEEGNKEEIPIFYDENILDKDQVRADLIENGTYRYEYDTRILEVRESSVLVEDSNYEELTVCFDSINETFAAGDMVTIETDGLIREMVPPWTKGISIKKKID